MSQPALGVAISKSAMQAVGLRLEQASDLPFEPRADRLAHACIHRHMRRFRCGLARHIQETENITEVSGGPLHDPVKEAEIEPFTRDMPEPSVDVLFILAMGEGL